jgi:hypothetical protein
MPVPIAVVSAANGRRGCLVAHLSSSYVSPTLRMDVGPTPAILSLPLLSPRLLRLCLRLSDSHGTKPTTDGIFPITFLVRTGFATTFPLCRSLSTGCLPF